jgi:hypothetical protein
MSFTNTPLFGGAITVDIPSNFADTRSVSQSALLIPTPHAPTSPFETTQLTPHSQIREVPDHQEVYLDADGYSSLVIEILERVHKPSNAEALQYHFADLIDGTGDSTTILAQEDVVFKHLRYVSCAHVTLPTPTPKLPPPASHSYIYKY